MKRLLLCCASLLLMLMLLTGCQPADPVEDVKPDSSQSASVKTVSEDSVERLVNNTYRKALGRHRLYCCDAYSDDDGTFHATFYGDDDRIEFFVTYDPVNKVLKSDAARVYHASTILENVGAIIEETTGLQGGELETDTYSIGIDADLTEEFLEDYDAFITHPGTKIDILLIYDKKVTDLEEQQAQLLIEKLQKAHFKGEVTYCGDEFFSDDISF